MAQNINAMHCKNPKLLRQLINQKSKINIGQPKNNILRLYGQDSSRVEPIRPYRWGTAVGIFGITYILCEIFDNKERSGGGNITDIG